jgi:hypothetical protein
VTRTPGIIGLPGKKYVHQGPEFTDIMNKIPLSIQRRNQNNDGTQDKCIQDQKDEIKRTNQGGQDPVKDDLQCLCSPNSKPYKLGPDLYDRSTALHRAF